MSLFRHMSLLLSVNVGSLVLSDTCTSLTLYHTITSCSFVLLLSELCRVSSLFLFCICSSLLPVLLFVSFFVHFLICPLCRLVCYIKYLPLSRQFHCILFFRISLFRFNNGFASTCGFKYWFLFPHNLWAAL